MKKEKSKINVKESNMLTNGFFDAACYLKKCEKADGFLLGIYAPAYTVNLALACELYFKQLLYINGIDAKENGRNIHGLKALFKKVPSNIQTEIQKIYLENKNSNQYMSIDECLNLYDTAFEDWRYTYEGGKDCNTVADKDFFDFVHALKMVADKKAEETK